MCLILADELACIVRSNQPLTHHIVMHVPRPALFACGMTWNQNSCLHGSKQPPSHVMRRTAAPAHSTPCSLRGLREKVPVTSIPLCGLTVWHFPSATAENTFVTLCWTFTPPRAPNSALSRNIALQVRLSTMNQGWVICRKSAAEGACHDAPTRFRCRICFTQ